jgi:serine/threonine protein kinase
MQCNDDRLKRLLSADESSAEYEAVTSHVEGCPECQQRLVELFGDHDLLQEVRDTLLNLGATEPYQGSMNSSVVISIEAAADDDYGAECEPVSLDFLAPPSHPEMLGRIGRYEVERMIGSGGMGIVLKGFDTELHRVVAIKVLKPHLAHNGAARHRFAREAQSAAAVVHEHVIPIHDVQSDGEMPFLVMQYVPGQSLQARVDERGPLEPKEVLRIARQAAAGLAAAHAQGLVHRDVKPANILMEDSVERVLISDFGLARTVDDATLTKTGIVAGTPHYMSPEQASGQAVDHRSDLFSLGSVIYFMCTGRPPFRAEHALAILNRICHDPHRPIDEVNSDIPAELAETVDQLLSKNPTDRFRNAHEVEQRLESILARLQNGQRGYRLRWRRSWLRWRGTVGKAARDLSVVVACVLVGIGLSRWYGPISKNAQVAATTAERAAQSSTTLVGDPQVTSNGDGEARAEPRSRSTPKKKAPSPKVELNHQPAFPPDIYLSQLDEIRSAVSEIEDRWNQDRSASIPRDSSDNEWQRELQEVEATLQTLEQSSPRRNVNFQHD